MFFFTMSPFSFSNKCSQDFSIFFLFRSMKSLNMRCCGVESNNYNCAGQPIEKEFMPFNDSNQSANSQLTGVAVNRLVHQFCTNVTSDGIILLWKWLSLMKELLFVKNMKVLLEKASFLMIPYFLGFLSSPPFKFTVITFLRLDMNDAYTKW